jgi:hypothetical protein
MTLSEFALLVGADPKWVLNASAALGEKFTYSAATARRLAVARALGDALHISLLHGDGLAVRALRGFHGKPTPVTIAPAHGADVVVTVDIYRLVAAFNTRLARLRTMYAPAQRGRRPSPRRDALHAATRRGLDLSLLAANLRRTPAERLRQLDAMVDFRMRVRRVDA